MEVFLCFASGDTKHLEEIVGGITVQKVEQLGRNGLLRAILANSPFTADIISISAIQIVIAKRASARGVSETDDKSRKIRAGR